MRLTVVSVYDVGVGAYGRPVFVRSKGEAVRSFMDELNKPHSEQMPNQMRAHPQDFQLYFLGEFDDETGRFVDPPEQPLRIAEGANLVK